MCVCLCVYIMIALNWMAFEWEICMLVRRYGHGTNVEKCSVWPWVIAFYLRNIATVCSVQILQNRRQKCLLPEHWWELISCVDVMAGSSSCQMMSYWRFCRKQRIQCASSRISRNVLKALPSWSSLMTKILLEWFRQRTRWFRLTSELALRKPR